MKHIANSTRNRSILHLTFTIGLNDIQTSIESRSREFDRLPTSCICNWDSFFLSSEVEMATNRP